MTDQELKKLKRSELLEMMIEQGKTIMELREELSLASKHQADTDQEVQDLKETIERLKRKLNSKDIELNQQAMQLDETYKRLSKKLNAKDAEIDKQAKQLEETYKRLAHKLDVKDNKIRELKAVILKGRNPDVTDDLLDDEYDPLPEDLARQEEAVRQEEMPKEPLRPDGKGALKVKRPAKKPKSVRIERVKAGN